MSDWYLILMTLLAIVIVIIGVTVLKLHPFISLLIASLFLGIVAGLPVTKIVSSYETGVGNTLSSLAVIIGLGTVLGGMITQSGGGTQIANTLTHKLGMNRLHWAMMISGFIIGLPVFFEVGVVLLIPLVISVSRNTKKSILFVGLPLIAGLSIVHGIVPPHPGAMTAIDIYHADIGKVLIYALIVAIPSVIVAGPLFGKWIAKHVVPVGQPKLGGAVFSGPNGENDKEAGPLPSAFASFFTVLLPIILILIATIVPYLHFNKSVEHVIEFIGDPMMALLISVVVAFFTLGYTKKVNKGRVGALIDDCLKPIAAILLIIGSGGGFKQILIDSGVGDAIANISGHFNMSPIVLAFIIAALVRIATGSATVSLITAAGIVAPIIEHTTGVNKELLVIATGAGSLIFSHVNDAGFWLIKEYLGLTVKETFKTWTVLETLLSVTAFICVLIVSVFV
ncbi:gluconate transporter [Pullulanibacillus pueri]|uniref:2-keto-3-deoxygluconate permease n=1 Tax=Pullulanibacillus pueri TaxID=1437324 RepID=A0A8J2ZWT1_9BACL|nr:gluconate:H+ symporter [Pullulanibacillus pueri]MBM7681767.1 gluconate transporter [Pullulanibacillus pueri]GGH84182.1 2-keto-3-deoxygluconate permease [Pullulanibacillus pueri]